MNHLWKPPIQNHQTQKKTRSNKGEATSPVLPKRRRRFVVSGPTLRKTQRQVLAIAQELNASATEELKAAADASGVVVWHTAGFRRLAKCLGQVSKSKMVVENEKVVTFCTKLQMPSFKMVGDY